MNSNLMKLAVTAGVLFVAWKYGTPEIKGMALGAAGVIALNQIPFARDGQDVRLVA